jgi:hypothetical protein
VEELRPLKTKGFPVLFRTEQKRQVGEKKKKERGREDTRDHDVSPFGKESFFFFFPFIFFSFLTSGL